MIPLILRQLRWRLLVVAAICVVFYVIEPALHVHAEDAAGAAAIVPPGEIAFSMANLAGASMLVLLTGFVSTDRRRGYYRIYFSHPTRPLAYYGLRWLIAYALTLAVSAVFFVVSQLAAWGELRAPADTLLQPALFALVYGGLVAFVSVVFPRGDSLIAFAVWGVTASWYEFFLRVFDETGIEPPLPLLVRQAVSFVLPPHLAVGDLYEALRAGHIAWGTLGFIGGYGAFWLALAALLLWSREWP